MYRRFIATITAASIAITTIGALPAAADDRDTARAVAAILGIAVLGKIIHDSKDDRDVVTRRHNTPVYQAPSRKQQAHQRRVQKQRYEQQRAQQQRHKQRVQRQRQHSHNSIQPRPLPNRVRRGN